MFCKYCGENNVDGAKFCKNCGKPLMTTSSADGTAAGYNPEMTPGYTPTSQQNHKKSGIIAIVAIVAAVLIAVAVIFSIFHAVKGRSPEKTIDQLVTSLFKLDADGIIDTFPKEAVI